MIQKEGEGPVRILSGRDKTVKNVVYILENELMTERSKKYTFVKLNETFELEDKSGNKEKYKATKFDLKTRSLELIDYKARDTVSVTVEPILNAPGTRSTGTPSFEEELLR